MIQTCPNCNREYKTALDRKTTKNIQDEYPSAPAWMREQLITGICSDKCWNEFLGGGNERLDENNI